jgi:hypothetical protein
MARAVWVLGWLCATTSLAGCSCDSVECVSGFLASVTGTDVVAEATYGVLLEIDGAQMFTCDIAENAVAGYCRDSEGELGLEFHKFDVDGVGGDVRIDIRGGQQPRFVTLTVIKDGSELVRHEEGPLSYPVTTDECFGECRAAGFHVEVPEGA